MSGVISCSAGGNQVSPCSYLPIPVYGQVWACMNVFHGSVRVEGCQRGRRASIWLRRSAGYAVGRVGFGCLSGLFDSVDLYPRCSEVRLEAGYGTAGLGDKLVTAA